MALDYKTKERILTIFTKEPCWMIASLAEELQYSIPSTRRFLSEIGYYSSITHNGRWYTIHHIPKFGRDGLWFINDIGFSKAGSLTKTLINIVTNSSRGFSADQLGQKLRCRCHSVLVKLCRQGKIQRRKHGPSYVYLAADASLANAQLQTMISPLQPQLPAEIALLVLVEYIRHPETSYERLAEKVSKRTKVTVNKSQIKRLFRHHGLKKTTHATA